MRCLERNKQSFYYSTYIGKTEIIQDGLKTGQYHNTYSLPVLARANISPARGTSDLEQFGNNTDYSKTIVTSDMGLPIDVNSILWVGIEPDTDGEEGQTKHNYVVVSIARSINSVTYAIREVTTT